MLPPRLRVLLVVLLPALAGCEPDVANKASPSSASSAPPPASAATAVRRPPVLFKLALLADKTGSARETCTPEVEYEAVENLIKSLSSRAELDLGVGLITDQSDRGLIRLRLVPQPERPTEVHEVLPKNPFERLYAPPKPRNTGDFEKVLDAWAAERDKQLATFKTAATALLSAPTRGRTDIEGALLRADMMLGEPEARFAPDRVHRWAIFATDGLHTTCRGKATWMSGATLIVVNASGTIGVLERLNPLRFESAARALQFVVDQERSDAQR